MKTIGIDLGTSNTCLFAWDSDGWSAGKRPGPLLLPDIADASGSLATVVLYEDDAPLCIGNLAESEYFAHPDMRKKRRICAQFKPEIGRGEPLALRAMTDFLALLAKALPVNALDNTAVYVGIPARARHDFAISLGSCFAKAGWPSPLFVREPDAALISCLDLGILSVADIGRRCLILDFGGGTFDYSCVESLNTLSDGGDALYGGRLFDDLFYQVFCAHNADFARAMPQSPFAFYAHWVECKRQKEIFSRIASRNIAGQDAATMASLYLPWYDRRGERREAFVCGYGRNDFISDAEHFTATEGLLQMLSAYANSGGLGRYALELLQGREIPLLGWLDELLENVPERGKIEKVVLTGGSSRWFFVHESAKRHFPAAAVVQSERDYEDIAYGLALFPALTIAGQKARQLLEGKLAAFCAREAEIARREVAGCGERLIAAAASHITGRDILPALEAARQARPTIEELELAIEGRLREDGELAQLFEGSGQNLAASIRTRLDDDFKKWLAENGIPLAIGVEMPENVFADNLFAGLSAEILRPDDLDRFLLTRLLPALAAFSAAGFIAHALEPVSIVMGGGAVFGGTWLMGRLAPQALRRRRLPVFMLKGKIRSHIAGKIRGHIESHLRETFADFEKNITVQISAQIGRALKAMIANLGIFNQISVNGKK